MKEISRRSKMEGSELEVQISVCDGPTQERRSVISAVEGIVLPSDDLKFAWSIRDSGTSGKQALWLTVTMVSRRVRLFVARADDGCLYYPNND
jgi:hypothetical protein